MSQSAAFATRKIVHIVPPRSAQADAVDRLDFDNAPMNIVTLPA